MLKIVKKLYKKSVQLHQLLDISIWQNYKVFSRSKHMLHQTKCSQHGAHTGMLFLAPVA